MRLQIVVFVKQLAHGEYILHEVAGSSELAGSDVILVHRLMKNTVTEATGLTGYGLISRPAIDAIGVAGATEGMVEHVEHYEDFGDVTVYIEDLRRAWVAEADRSRVMVGRDEAVGYSEVFVPVTPWIAWAYATDGEVKKRMYGVESHERTDGEARLGIGATFHCKHQLGDVDYMIVDLDAPHYYTNENQASNVETMTTLKINPVEGGVEVQMLMSLAEGTNEALANVVQAGTDLAASRFLEIITAELENGVISKDQMALTEAAKEQASRPGVAEGRFGDLSDPTKDR